MIKINKEYKKLHKNYRKKLEKLHKNSLDAFQPPLEYFVTYLQLLRDKLFMEIPYTTELGENDLELVSLITALQEFENYNTCIYKFYDIKDSKVVHKAEYSAEEALAAFQKEQTYHWEAFWNLVKLCAEGWGANAKP